MTDIQAAPSVWTPAERLAWAPPRQLTVSEWADAYRVLPPGTSAEPGRWRTDRTPYLRAVMDALGDPWTQEVDLMKGPQVGGSEALRCAQGYWIDQDPGPCLIVFPSEPAARENIDERVVPMIRATPRLARYLTGVSRDVKLSHVALRTMTIYAGHAGSPQALATRPCRYVVCDEVDKYPPFAGRETDPITLAEARTHTYGPRKKVVRISTPTTSAGPIATSWQDSPRRYEYKLPCPRCGAFQALDFERFDWHTGTRPLPDGAARFQLADDVEAGRTPVWVNCGGCGARWTESDKARRLGDGRWLDQNGEPLDPRSIRKSFHVPPAISPWVAWGKLVAEFLRTRATIAGLMAFANQWEGKPFEERIASVKAEDLRRKPAGGIRGTLPPWCTHLVATADAGGDHAWWVVRAWAPGYRSQLVDYGRSYGFENLRKAVLDREFPFGDGRQAPLTPCILLIDSGGTRTIDSGSRTDEVYKFSLTDPRIQPLKGDVKATTYEQRPIVQRRISYNPPNADPYDVVLTLVNTGYYKDILARRLAEKLPEGGPVWEELPGVDDDYIVQLSSEHRVVEREGRRTVARWRPVSKATANHFWDCSVYQCAAADLLRLDLLGVEPQAPTAPSPEPELQRARQPRFQLPGGRKWLSQR